LLFPFEPSQPGIRGPVAGWDMRRKVTGWVFPNQLNKSLEIPIITALAQDMASLLTVPTFDLVLTVKP
jgi:hypothetical protein